MTDMSAGGAADLHQFEADALVHLAAIPSPGVVEDSELFANNTLATFNVLRAAGEAGIVKAVVASSISIYGLVWATRRPPLDLVPLSEVAAVRPTDTYALTKQVDEATAGMMARRYGMAIACLRFPNVSDEADVLERRRQVDEDPTIAHRELWAYLTFADAGRAVEAAIQASFEGLLIANVVSPASLYSGDVRELVTRFYPEAASELGAGKSQPTYATRVAQDILGFTGETVSEDSATSRPAQPVSHGGNNV